MNGVLLTWIVALALFCALALFAGWRLFVKARDRQHADWEKEDR